MTGELFPNGSTDNLGVGSGVGSPTTSKEIVAVAVAPSLSVVTAVSS